MILFKTKGNRTVVSLNAGVVLGRTGDARCVSLDVIRGEPVARVPITGLTKPTAQYSLTAIPWPLAWKVGCNRFRMPREISLVASLGPFRLYLWKRRGK